MDDSESTIKSTAKGALRWQKKAPWWIVMIQGVILLILGLYMFFVPTKTYTVLAWVVIIALLASGGFSLYLALQAEQKDIVKTWTLVHGIVGVAAGIILALLLIFDLFPVSTQLIFLALSCLAFGGVGLYMLIDKNLTSLRRISILGTIFFLLVGGLVLLQAFSVGVLVTLIDIINMIVVIAGIALIIWGLILRNERPKQASTT
jgi:uncharacterized membrane protein HdeD (DUF308 family)